MYLVYENTNAFIIQIWYLCFIYLSSNTTNTCTGYEWQYKLKNLDSLLSFCFIDGSCDSFTYSGIHHDFHIRWCLCRLIVLRRVSLMEQELLTLMEFTHVLSRLMLCSILSLFIWSLYCLSFELGLSEFLSPTPFIFRNMCSR